MRHAEARRSVRKKHKNLEQIIGMIMKVECRNARKKRLYAAGLCSEQRHEQQS